MITGSIFSNGGMFPGGYHGRSGATQSAVYVVNEYFISASKLSAMSDVDYLVSPTEQIRTQLNKWLASFGQPTRIECDDAAWLIAPSGQISSEFFNSYEPFVRAVMLYRASIIDWNDDEMGVPSQQQINAALLGMANLMAWLVPAPSPMVLEDGTVGGYWRHGRRYVSIDFEVDGQHSWAGTDGENFHSGTWNLPGSPLPPALFDELRAIAS